MEIIEQKEEGLCIFSLLGRLDSNTSPVLEKRLFEVINGGEKSFIIDFEGLEYMSSAGWRVLLKTAQELKRSGGKIILCCMKDYIREVFEIAGFEALFLLVPSKVEAMGQF